MSAYQSLTLHVFKLLESILSTLPLALGYVLLSWLSSQSLASLCAYCSAAVPGPGCHALAWPVNMVRGPSLHLQLFNIRPSSD